MRVFLGPLEDVLRGYIRGKMVHSMRHEMDPGREIPASRHRLACASAPLSGIEDWCPSPTLPLCGYEQHSVVTGPSLFSCSL